MSTPIRRQYLDVKGRHPDAILLFRLGDFYEAFDDDAKLVAAELNVTLTSKPMGKGLRVPLAGIPYHALETYLARLIAAGHRVAICEQLADAATAKGLVPRDVVRVVTPGTMLESGVVEGRANNYLAALVLEGDDAGLAWVDVSTGEFVTSRVPAGEIENEIARLSPSELLLPSEASAPSSFRGAITSAEAPSTERAERALLDHFETATLEPYGCAGSPPAIRAAATALAYVARTASPAVALLTGLTTRTGGDTLILDAATRRNLDLFPKPETPGASLLETLDLTHTAAGARLLRRWLAEPLNDAEAIRARQERVHFFLLSATHRLQLASLLRSLPDLERLIARIAAGYAAPRELVALRRGLEVLPSVVEALGEGVERFPRLIAAAGLREVAATIAATIVDDPPPAFDDGGVVREGCDPALDKLRRRAKDARGGLAELERTERERTGIRSLKVGYQRAFGYYIEVSNAHRDAVPDDYEPRQTLVNAQRYATPELRRYEAEALEARQRIAETEADIFRRVCAQTAAESERVRAVAAALAQVDVFVAFAEGAARYDYARPEVDDSDALAIHEGRHPVVERWMAPGAFVPNDTALDSSANQIAIITGPNMAGKSTYLRQVALIALIAHVGCYVPARSARVGVLDRIFTRVGAHDDLASGRSTFMVEMVETATILHQATRRSLVILDEVGRGTSTYDGLAIARAVVEYLHNRPELGAKTLFATHYHELTALAETLPRVHNQNVAVSEEGGRVTFLYRIVPGGADRSYGVHVARLAGLPPAVVARATEILAALESEASGRDERRAPIAGPAGQMSLFAAPDPVAQEIAALDIDALSPLDAITRLYELRERARRSRP